MKGIRQEKILRLQNVDDIVSSIKTVNSLMKGLPKDSLSCLTLKTSMSFDLTGPLKMMAVVLVMTNVVSLSG